MNARAATANLAWLAGSLPAYWRFKHALAAPEKVQAGLLRRAIETHAGTAYGRAHRFEGIGSAAEFSRRVPLTTYEELQPWIDRIQAGEPHVLTRDRVTRLVPTSGSSGARKLIPFTAGLRGEFNAAIGPWMVDLARQFPGIAAGPAYWSVTPAGSFGEAGHAASAVPIGFDDDSEYVGAWAKRWVEQAMAAPSALRLVKDMDAFRYVVLLCLLRQPELRLISVWHPSFLALLMDGLPGWWSSLVKDIHEGTCAVANEIPDEVRATLRLRGNPPLARKLSHCDAGRTETVWPKLRAVSCWGDAHAALGLDDLRRRFPQATIQAKGLLATEAVVTIPFGSMHPAAVTSHFFEFIDEAGEIGGLHTLRMGSSYEVVVTTGGGLWRYRLGDRVEVSGFVGATPSLHFLGRGGGVSDRRGEKLTEPFVRTAIASSCAELGVTPRFVLLAPDERADVCGYTLYLEGAGDEGTKLVERIEDKLRASVHYDWCRKLGQLQPLRLFAIDEQGYEIFVAAEMERGSRLGDIKPAALSLKSDWTRRFKGRYRPM